LRSLEIPTNPAMAPAGLDSTHSFYRRMLHVI
jgi:hypothetical protein